MAKGQKKGKGALRSHQVKDMWHSLDASFETLRSERQGLVAKATASKSKARRVVTRKDLDETGDLLASMMNKV